MTFDQKLLQGRGCLGFGSWALLIGGTLFLISAVYQTWLPIFGETTDGVVTQIISRANSKSRRSGESDASYSKRSGGVSYDLMVKYAPTGGQPMEFKTTSTFGLHVKQDDPVQVIYMKADPMNAEINSTTQLWLPLCVGYTVSLLCIGGAIFLRRALSRAAESAAAAAEAGRR